MKTSVISHSFHSGVKSLFTLLFYSNRYDKKTIRQYLAKNHFALGFEGYLSLVVRLVGLVVG